MANANYPCASCPTDCTSLTLPAVVFDECPNIDSVEESEICTIYLDTPDPAANGCLPLNPIGTYTDTTGGTDDTVNVTVLTTWLTTAVDNTTVGSVREINVIGDKPEPEDTVKTISKRKQLIISRKHTLNIDVLELPHTNYEFMRKMQCGGSLFLWFRTIGGGFYGGENGIKVTIEKSFVQFDRGEDASKTGILKFFWFNDCDPPRDAFPIAQVC